MMDGNKCQIDQPVDQIVQSLFYNRWKLHHFVTVVFCFVPDGTFPADFYHVCIYCQTSVVVDWGDLYNKLENFIAV